MRSEIVEGESLVEIPIDMNGQGRMLFAMVPKAGFEPARVSPPPPCSVLILPVLAADIVKESLEIVRTP